MTPETAVDDGTAPPGADGSLAFQRTVSWLLAGAGKLVLQRWASMFARLELTSSQYKLLLALDETGALGQQQLAELIGIDPRNAVPIIETSVAHGLLNRRVNPDDRRRRVLELSAEGRELAAELRSQSAAIEEELLEALNPKDRIALERILRVLHDAAEPHHE